MESQDEGLSNAQITQRLLDASKNLCVLVRPILDARYLYRGAKLRKTRLHPCKRRHRDQASADIPHCAGTG